MHLSLTSEDFQAAWQVDVHSAGKMESHRSEKHLLSIVQLLPVFVI